MLKLEIVNRERKKEREWKFYCFIASGQFPTDVNLLGNLLCESRLLFWVRKKCRTTLESQSYKQNYVPKQQNLSLLIEFLHFFSSSFLLFKLTWKSIISLIGWIIKGGGGVDGCVTKGYPDFYKRVLPPQIWAVFIHEPSIRTNFVLF